MNLHVTVRLIEQAYVIFDGNAIFLHFSNPGTVGFGHFYQLASRGNSGELNKLSWTKFINKNGENSSFDSNRKWLECNCSDT